MVTARNSDLVNARLEEQVRDLRAALDHADEAICRTDRDGRIVAVNRACLALTGYSAEQMLGRSWEQMVVPADRAPLRASVRAAGRSTVERQARAVRQDGSTVETLLKLVPVVDRDLDRDLDRDGHAAGATPSGYYIYIRDLSERKRMENQLIFAGRMAAVGTLAAGVAHEINNPLAYILANIDFSRQQMSAAVSRMPDDDDFRRALGEIVEALGEARQGAERVRNIVRDLRVFARGDEEARGPVALRRVLDSSINMAWNEIRHRARLVKDYGDAPLVEGNESRLGQVFLNLLLNAAHAIEEGAAERHEIRVSTRTDTAGRAVVEVRDTGRGIPAGLRARIFDPFFTTKAAGEGTGLGLWICQGILSGLGGAIAVESEEGRGSLFRVTLPPVAAEVPVRRALTPPPDLEPRGGRLLIVDDEPMILGALRRALVADYQVTCVGDGRAALAKLRAGERYDAMLCDLMMPEMTGMELFAEMERMAPEQTERVIFVTGGAFTPRAREFLDRVPNARIEKPIDFQNLRMLVRNLIGGRRAVTGPL
jgi:PAS domain S-box-containing protein